MAETVPVGGGASSAGGARAAPDATKSGSQLNGAAPSGGRPIAALGACALWFIATLVAVSRLAPSIADSSHLQVALNALADMPATATADDVERLVI